MTLQRKQRELRRQLQRWWVQAERARWEYGTLGYSDGVSVEADRQDFVHVKMDKGNYTTAYNGGAVDNRYGLPVRMRDEAGVWIIEGVNKSALVGGDANAPSKVYTVNDVAPDSHGNVALDTDDIPEGATNEYYTAERARDDVGAALVEGAGIDITVSDAGDTITIASTITQYTDEMAQDAVGGILTDTATVDFTYTDATPTITADVKDNSITFAKMQDIATDSLIGRDTASTGDPENITLNATLSMDGSGHLQRAALTGDVTASAGSNSTTIANDATTFAKMQNIATDSLVGRDTAGTGDPENILLGASLSMDGSGNLQRAALTGDVTASANSNTTTIANNAVTTVKILDANVTLAKLANIATDSLIGRDTAGTGVPENILLNATLSMDGSGNLQRAALTGDVTASAGSNATVIGANKVLTAMIADAQVSLAKMADLAQSTIIGRAAGAGTGVPTALSVAQVVAIINSTLDHGGLAGLSDDDHAQYLLLAGRSGGQTANGDTASGGNLTLMSTAHATKGKILFGASGYDEANERLGVGASDPASQLEVTATTTAASRGFITGQHNSSAAAALFYFQKSRGTRASPTTVNNGDFAGVFYWQFHDGTNYLATASIAAKVNGTRSTGTIPTDLIISTGSADDLGLTNERMRILSTGVVGIGIASPNANVLGIIAGTSSNDAAVGGVLYVDSGTYANSGSGETDLVAASAYTVPANTLAVNNQALHFEIWGTLATSNAKTVKVKFGSDSWTIINAEVSAGNFVIRGNIIRTGSATQDVHIKEEGDYATTPIITISTATRTLSSSNILKITGTGTSTNDIKVEYYKVWWEDANT